MKKKILDSMACGTPVAATTQAVEGMLFKPGEDLIIADTPAGFVEVAVKLYTNELFWKKISDRATNTVARFYSKEIAGKQLRYFLKKLESG